MDPYNPSYGYQPQKASPNLPYMDSSAMPTSMPQTGMMNQPMSSYSTMNPMTQAPPGPIGGMGGASNISSGMGGYGMGMGQQQQGFQQGFQQSTPSMGTTSMQQPGMMGSGYPTQTSGAYSQYSNMPPNLGGAIPSQQNRNYPLVPPGTTSTTGTSGIQPTPGGGTQGYGGNPPYRM